MVFKFSSIYADGMDQEANERKTIKNGSGHIGQDHKNKRAAAAPPSEKVVVEPEAKIVEASDADGSEIEKRGNHGHRDRDASIASTPPRVSNVPPTNTGAIIQAVQILSDDEKKELSHKLESWRRNLNINVKGKIRLVLKTELHCKGCAEKIRQELKKLQGVDAIGFDAGRDLVAVIGTVDEGRLVWYMEQKFKQEVIVLLLEKPNNSEKATMSLSSSDVNAGSGGEKAPNQEDMDEPVHDELVDDGEKKSQEDHTKPGPAGNIPSSVNRVTSEPLLPVYEKDVDGVTSGMKWNKDMPRTDKQDRLMDDYRHHGIFNDDNPNIACSIL